MSHHSETKFTRRQIALALSASTLLAQAPSPALPSNPEEEIKAVKASFQQNVQQLAKFDLPMLVEPAVHFKA